MSLEFTFKNIDRVAGSNVKRQILPIIANNATIKPFTCSRRTTGVERMRADYDWDYE